MNSIAIIAEFNPFHNGHKRLIDALHEKYGNTPIIIIMSGSFVQRGEPALFDKWHRAQWAISCGADLVIELPCAYALSGAETFASGGVRLAVRMGCTHLACGIEHGNDADIMLLATTANKIDLSNYLEDARNTGLPYGTALSQALSDALPEKADLLQYPNTLLALEYAKAINLYAPPMKLVSIPRTSQHTGKDCNSTALRQAIRDHVATELLPAYIPDVIREDLWECLKSGLYIDYGRYYDMILYQSRSLAEQELAKIAAFSEGIEHRWHDLAGTSSNWQEALSALKTKRYTYSRLCRMGANTVLHITKDAMLSWQKDGPQYARILAMNSNGSSFLRLAQANTDTLFITKITKAGRELSPTAHSMLALDLLATDIQFLCMQSPTQRLARQDFYQSPAVQSD